jgi:quercetin dioxygenase-like cupin family protein
MMHGHRLWCTMLVALLIVYSPYLAQGQEPASQPAGRNMKDMKFVMFPGLPTCALGSVASGDPTKGPSVILARLTAGCSLPWHWHTANEQLMIVSGAARVEMKDGKPLTLTAGGFVQTPSRHVHQLRCTSACALFVTSDAPFDLHYVDAKGKEISPDEALKAVREKAAKPMQ